MPASQENRNCEGAKYREINQEKSSCIFDALRALGIQNADVKQILQFGLLNAGLIAPKAEWSLNQIEEEDEQPTDRKFEELFRASIRAVRNAVLAVSENLDLSDSTPIRLEYHVRQLLGEWKGGRSL